MCYRPFIGNWPASLLNALTGPLLYWTHSLARFFAERTHWPASLLNALTGPLLCWTHSLARFFAERTHWPASLLNALTGPLLCWTHSLARFFAERTHWPASLLNALKARSYRAENQSAIFQNAKREGLIAKWRLSYEKPGAWILKTERTGKELNAFQCKPGQIFYYYL